MSTHKKIHAIDPDFYCANAYEQSQKRGVHHILIKVLSIVVLVGVALWGYTYMRSHNYVAFEFFTTHSTAVQKEIPIEETKNEKKVMEEHVQSSKVVDKTSNMEFTSEEITDIVKNVLIQLNTQEKSLTEDQNNSTVDDRMHLKKDVKNRLKSDKLSQEYVESVQKALGK